MKINVAIIISLAIFVFTFLGVYHVAPTSNKDTLMVLDAALVSGYLMLGLFYLGAYIQQRKDLFQLYFSSYCITQGLYVSTLNEQLISLVMDELTSEALNGIQLYLIHIVALFFMLYAYRFFQQYARKQTVIFLSVLLGLQGTLFGLLQVNEWLLSGLPLLYKDAVMISGLSISNLYIIFILIKAVIGHKEGVEYLVVIVTTFICHGMLIGLNFLLASPVGYLHVVLFVIMTISVSLLMGHRFHTAYLQVEQLSQNLLIYDRLKDEFIINTSQELQAPLHDMIQVSKSLMEGTAGPLRSKQQERVLHIHNVGKRLALIVEQFVDVSKIKQGERSVEPTLVDLRCIDDVLKEIRYLLPHSYPVAIRNEVVAPTPFIYADEQRVKQIIFNLMNNAVQHTTQGTITISAEVKEQDMHITVADTGSGIAKAHVGHIFTPYYQVDNMEKVATEGLEMGLSITKQLVELSGGSIWAQSVYDEGSRFTFTLPLATPEQIIVRTTQNSVIGSDNTREQPLGISKLKLPQKIIGTNRATVLVVDDDHKNLDVLIELVGSLDYTVIAVDNGPDAMAMLERNVIDLMIVDLIMPGYVVCKQVRQAYDLVELPIVILTEGAKSTDFVTAMKVGANDFLRKPLLPEELKVKIASLVAMKRAAQQSIHDELSNFHAQIAPHFLYNTLNTIIALTYKDTEKAREALQHLATYFRAKLDFYSQNTVVLLEQELDLVQSYVAIEQMRYGDRLIVNYAIDEQVKARIPSLTIQPLVENAIRHGISKKDTVGTLGISVQQQGGDVVIRIEDDGVGMSEEKQAALLNNTNGGIGFVNSFNKLKLVKNAQFSLESAEGKGTTITIILPGVKNSEGRVNR